MRWFWRIAGAALAAGLLLAAAGAALPLYVPWLAGTQGVRVGSASWCGPGLCLERVRRGGISAERVILSTDRRVLLLQPVVTLDAQALGGAGGGGGIGSGGALPGWLGPVEVRELQIAGLPVDLPPLSGTVLPERSLSGEGVEIAGDRATLSRPGPFGPLKIAVERRRDAAGTALDLSVTCAPCAYGSEALGGTVALESVTVAGRLDGEGFAGSVRAGAVEVAVTVARPERIGSMSDTALTGTFRLEGQPIAELYALLGGVIPEAAKARIRGTVSGGGTFAWPGPELTFTPEIEGFSVDGLIGSQYRAGTFRYMARWGPDDYRRRQSGEGTPGWVSLTDLQPWLPAAVIAAEDGAFRSHPGYSIEDMLRAAAENDERGEIRQGGSTLTQQLAKNLFLSGERTYVRKLRELLYAVEMERELGKPRILELYLNIVEWGQGVHGAGPAADVYFLKSPAGLLPEEAAWMAGLLRHPESAWRREYLAGKPDPRRVQQILGRMADLPEEERAAAMVREIRLIPPPAR